MLESLPMSRPRPVAGGLAGRMGRRQIALLLIFSDVCCYLSYRPLEHCKFLLLLTVSSLCRHPRFFQVLQTIDKFDF